MRRIREKGRIEKEKEETKYIKDLWHRYKLAQKFLYSEKQTKLAGQTFLSRDRLNY